MGDSVALERIASGFAFGPATVEAWAQHKGHVIVGITTERGSTQIRITPSGYVRVNAPTSVKPVSG